MTPALDRYAWTNRWRHYHPAEKLLLAGGLLLLSLLLPPLTTAPLILLTVWLAAAPGAGIPTKTLIWTLAAPAGFLLAGLPLLLLSVDLSGGVSLSAEGGDKAARLLARSLAAVASLALFALTTPVAVWAPLLRRGGVPAALVEILLLMYRLLFVVAEQAGAAARAQAARLGYDGARRSLRSLGLLIANLLQRSLAQARRLEIGLAARNFDGELRVLSPPHSLSRRRLLAIAAVLLAVALAGLLGDRWLTGAVG